MKSIQTGVLFILLSMLLACGNRVVGWPENDMTAPTVSSTTPANNATGVAFNAAITATFSEAMDPLTISTDSFILLDGTTPVPGSVSYAGVTALFQPEESLVPDTLYTVKITTSATDVAGNAIVADYVWSFTTGDNADTRRPVVIATNPLDDATSVSINTSVIATFSEAMKPLTISTTTFTVFAGTTPVTGVVTLVGVTALFEPADSLAANTLYTATITTAVQDLAGNALAAEYVWSFTTGDDDSADLTAPTVIATNPLDDATSVAVNSPVIATFSEAMNPLTITTDTFTVFDGTTPVTGVVTMVGLNAIFTPMENLGLNTLYTATILIGVTDLAGNAMANEYVWSFTTGTEPDEIAPEVIDTIPADEAVLVVLNTRVFAIFNEAMNPLTITTDSFTLFKATTLIDGDVTYLGVTATFAPTLALEADTEYTAIVSNEATDIAGNPMAEDYVWTFTTIATVVDARPSVISTIPEDDDVDVALNANVSATFSEEMDPLTIISSTFTVMNGLLPVEGLFSQIGPTVTFNPDMDLEPETEYTATITTGALDLAGLGLLTDYVWTFTTGLMLDETGPVIVLTNPADMQIDVPVDTTVSATFSEEMNGLTISTTNFTLTAPGPVDVNGSVLYDPITMTGTFTPDVALLPATTYTANVTIGATDLAGNALEAGFIANPWTFTTAEEQGPDIPIDMGLADPFAIAATAGIQNTITAPLTHINGDVVLDPNQTCNSVAVDNAGGFGLCNAMPPTISGIVITNTYPDTTTAALVKADLNAAFLQITPLEGPPAVGSLGDGIALAAPTTLGAATGSALVLGDNWFPGGVYKSITSILITGDITLDGQGNPNATFIFQAGSSLDTADGAISPAAHTRILLVNGAKASNVWWQVPSSATLGTFTEFEGNILAAVSITMKTGATSCGRLMAGAWVGGGGAFVFDSNIVSVPGPDGCPL